MRPPNSRKENMIVRRLHELTIERMSYELEDIEVHEQNVRNDIERTMKTLEHSEKQLAEVLEKKEWCNAILSEAKDALIKLDGK